MDFTTLVTPDTFQKLRCSSCKNYLSYLPICFTEEKQNICGRCWPTLPKDSYSKNEIYEALAQLIKFPCRYQNEGCLQTALPKDMPEHEKCCEFMLIQCPTNLFSQCPWKGPKPNALHHCQNKHSDLILKDGEFQLYLSKTLTCDNLLEHDSMVLVINQKVFTINKLLVLSLHFPDWNVSFPEVPCELHLKNADRTLIIQTKFVKQDQQNNIEVNLDLLTNGEFPSTLDGKVVFESLIPKNTFQSNSTSLNDAIISQIKCATCNEVCFPPIYFQQNADTLLGKNLLQCAECREKYSESTSQFNTRSVVLENIFNLLYNHCKNEKNGCTFMAKSDEMICHLKFCPHGSHTCPLNDYVECKWKDIGKNLIGHILECHSDFVLTSSTITENITGLKSRVDTTNSSTISNGTITNQCVSVFGAVSPTTNNIFSSGYNRTIKSANRAGSFSLNSAKIIPSVFPTSSPTAYDLFGTGIGIGQSTAITSDSTVKPALENSKLYIIKFAKDLFFLNFGKVDHYYYWDVQMFGQFQEGFMFELEIIDTKNKRNSLISKRPCTELKKTEELFKTRNCFFHPHQLADFILDNQITFKVHVYK